MPRPYAPPPTLPLQARPPVQPGVSRGNPFEVEGDSGVFMILTPDAYDTHKGVLGQYLYNPPLPRVWAGDVAEDPFMTAVVRFPDQAAADAAIAGMGG